MTPNPVPTVRKPTDRPTMPVGVTVGVTDDTMSKRTTATATATNGRTRRESRRATAATAAIVPTSDATATATVTDTPATVDNTPANVVRVLTFTDFGVDTPANVPAHIGAFTTAFRAIASMPVKTPTDRIAARDAFIAAVRATGVNGADTAAKHTGRFSSMPVFVAQNDMYVAMAFANVAIESGHVMAAWAAEFPGSACGRNVDGCHGVPYIGRDYAWSTLSEYTNGRHNRTSVDNGSVVVAGWVARNRKPIA